MGGGDIGLNPPGYVPDLSLLVNQPFVIEEFDSPNRQVTFDAFGEEDDLYDDGIPILFGDAPLHALGYDKKGSHCSQVFQTPNGTRLWVPEVKPDLKPIVGKIYNNWEDVVQMYESYAENRGFTVRIGPFKTRKGIITHRTLLCSRYGKPRHPKPFDSGEGSSRVPSRRSSYTVTDCKAILRLRIVKGTDQYEIYEFHEKHNHEMVSSDDMDLTRKGRHLQFEDIHFVHTMSMNKIGPCVAHRLQTALKGGHHNMRGTKNAYRNITRDIKLYIGNRDMKIFIKQMEEHATNLPNFSFEFYHDGQEVKSIFWADDVSKTSYKVFGDVVAFDATYATNKYNMVFVPFTGVDHHKRCVTFGAALLHNETVYSYEWLLRTFLLVHHKQPTLVLTDQDPAMRQAISGVFNKSIHRLCMWHIMKKLPSKISGDLLQNTDLRIEIHKLVWSVYIKPSTFEERWADLVHKYNLHQNIWLRDMYSIRAMWVPAYFRDFQMCCLMKTTSRCESSNSFFKLNSSHTNTMLQFLMAFQSSLDQQRYNQRLDEFNTNTSLPELHTHLPVEFHASQIYTRSLFLDVQKEIHKSVMQTFITNVETVGNIKVFTLSYMDHNMEYVNEFMVTHHISEGSYDCSCMSFTRIGYLCSHVFCVFRVQKGTRIPDRYIMNRWKKQALPSRIYTTINRLSTDQSDVAAVRNEVLDCFNVCVDRLSNQLDGLTIFADKIKTLKADIVEQFTVESGSKRRATDIENLVGRFDDAVDEWTPSQGIRNKGCGTNRRLIGPGEKAIEQSKKAERLCRSCNKFIFHDSRNCKEKDQGGPSHG